MPLITRRSSTRGLPLVSAGRCDAIRANCLSVSQKWSRLIGVPPQDAVNHENTHMQTGLMGPDPRTIRSAGEQFVREKRVGSDAIRSLVRLGKLAKNRLNRRC